MRLGRRGGDELRVMKVKLQHVASRNTILRFCRNLNSSAVKQTFGRVYVNRDMSYLRRKWEKRLRREYQRLEDLHPDGSVRLKNGKLYLGAGIKDCVNFANQLF